MAPVDVSGVLVRLAAGDESALAELLDRHWGAVVDYAFRLLGSRDAAQDVAQEAFVRLWEHRQRWAPDSSARAILLRIARNLAVDVRRAEAARFRWVAEAAPQAREAAVQQTELAEDQELLRALDRALDRLGEREREAVVLSRFHGLSRSQVAEVMGIAPSSVSNLLSVAMARLWRALAPHLDKPAVGAPPWRRLRRA